MNILLETGLLETIFNAVDAKGLSLPEGDAYIAEYFCANQQVASLVKGIEANQTWLPPAEPDKPFNNQHVALEQLICYTDEALRQRLGITASDLKSIEPIMVLLANSFH